MGHLAVRRFVFGNGKMPRYPIRSDLNQFILLCCSIEFCIPNITKNKLIPYIVFRHSMGAVLQGFKRTA